MSAMKFRHELAYDAPPERVFAMLADPEFRQAACAAQEVVSADVRLDRRAATGSAWSSTRCSAPPTCRRSRGPSPVRRPRRSSARCGPARPGGNLSIEAPGKPTSCERHASRSSRDGAGTREVVELEIKVKVPLIGGKLEKLMAEKVAAGMDAEHTVGTRPG